MRARPIIGGSNSLLPALLLSSFICIASAAVSVQKLESSVGYPTAGGVTVTVYGAGFGTSSSGLAVTIGSTACSQAIIFTFNSRITCNLGALLARACSSACAHL